MMCPVNKNTGWSLMMAPICPACTLATIHWPSICAVNQVSILYFVVFQFVVELVAMCTAFWCNQQLERLQMLMHVVTIQGVVTLNYPQWEAVAVNDFGELGWSETSSRKGFFLLRQETWVGFWFSFNWKCSWVLISSCTPWPSMWCNNLCVCVCVLEQA